ncbi:MAG: hypothetical protein ACRCXB_34015 [Aeromonadaceae bacterium]
MSDNAKNFDEFSVSAQPTFTDRLGVYRKTLTALIDDAENEFDATILGMGFGVVGKFSAGTTIINPRQALLWDIADGGDGQEYGWSGSFPKVVPAGSTPTSTGGIGAGAWLSRFDPQLRNQVRENYRRSYYEAGFNLVAGSFEVGGALVNSNDVILHEASGKVFSGLGPYPQAVPAGTDPASTSFTDRSTSLIVSDRIKTKFGTLNVFTDRVAYAPSVGIVTTNTPAQNTAALNAIRAAIPSVLLYIPSGTYQFDTFASTGLAGVEGDGKSDTIVELHGVSSPVMVQPGPITHSKIWFKSVAGSLEWSRVGMSNYAIFDKCKITGFIHTSPAPNAWGVYLDNVRGCRLYYCEIDDNSQSDIAIVEGVTDFMAVGCYSANGTLHINIEPNVNSPIISGVVLQGMNINKLQLLCNSLSGTAPDKAVTVLGCNVETLVYDGLGASFIETTISKYDTQLDGANRIYGANLTGIRADSRELLPDPMFSSVGETGAWRLQFSSTVPANRYTRGVENQLVIGLNNVASQTIITSGKIPCAPETAYLITLSLSFIQYAGRNDIVSVRFKRANGSVTGLETNLVKANGSFRPGTQQHIIASPTDAAFIELWVSSGDSTVDYQSVQYSYASIRQILTSEGGVDSSSIGFSQFPKRVFVGDTESSFLNFNHYFCPLPVGTEIEFSFSAGATRLSKVTVMATDSTGNLGSLQVISKYP